MRHDRCAAPGPRGPLPRLLVLLLVAASALPGCGAGSIGLLVLAAGAGTVLAGVFLTTLALEGAVWFAVYGRRTAALVICGVGGACGAALAAASLALPVEGIGRPVVAALAFVVGFGGPASLTLLVCAILEVISRVRAARAAPPKIAPAQGVQPGGAVVDLVAWLLVVLGAMIPLAAAVLPIVVIASEGAGLFVLAVPTLAFPLYGAGLGVLRRREWARIGLVAWSLAAPAAALLARLLGAGLPVAVDVAFFGLLPVALLVAVTRPSVKAQFARA